MKIPLVISALCLVWLVPSCSKHEDEKPKAADEKAKALQDDE